MKSIIKAVLKDNRAVAAIEFALIAPVIVCLIAYALESIRLQIVALLLERTAYSLGYSLKIDENRNANFEALAEKTMKNISRGIFNASNLTIEAKSNKNMLAIKNGQQGCGEGKEIVHLKLIADIKLFGGLFDNPVIIQKTVNYFYINELI